MRQDGRGETIYVLPSITYPRSEVFVFWDIDRYPCNFDHALQILRRGGYSGTFFIRTYAVKGCVDTRLNLGRDWNFCVTRVTEEDEDAKVTRMLLDIVFWAMNCDDIPQNLMIISQPSKDTQRVIQALESKRFNLIFQPSDDVRSIVGPLCRRGFKPCEIEVAAVYSPPNVKEADIDGSNRLDIFWLVEDCISNPVEIWHNIRSTLDKKGYGKDIWCMQAYGFKSKFPQGKIPPAYHKTGAGLELLPDIGERARVFKMLLDLIHQARGAKWRPSNVVVISEPFEVDAHCAHLFEYFEQRGFRFFYVLPDYMFTFGTSLWSAKRLSS